MVYNAVTAIEAVKAILPGAGDETLRAALKKSAMPARLEFFDLKCSVILDGGHNEEGAAALRNFTGKCVTGGKITAVCSIMSDKDYEKYLDTVLPLADRVIATQADVPRALDAHAPAECAEKICNDVSEIPDAVSAVKYALDTADDDETDHYKSYADEYGVHEDPSRRAERGGSRVFRMRTLPGKIAAAVVLVFVLSFLFRLAVRILPIILIILLICFLAEKIRR